MNIHNTNYVSSFGKVLLRSDIQIEIVKSQWTWYATTPEIAYHIRQT